MTRTKELGLISIAGVATAAEAATAVKVGGDILKIFPTSEVSPAAARAIIESVSSKVPVIVAGGIEVGHLEAYFNSGASGFAVGKTLFKPDLGPAEIKAKASEFVGNWCRLQWGQRRRKKALTSD